MGETATQEGQCNCRNKNDCPLNGKCLTTSIIYQAKVTSPNQPTETYIGLTENSFKARFSNHKQSFQKESLKNATELSKCVWKLKLKNLPYNITCSIVGRAKLYINRTKKCNLCTLEKLYIIYHNEMASLNKRTELISTCRHRKKYLLECIV